MEVLDLSHHKEIAKEFKFIEGGEEVDVSKFTLDKNTTVIVGANNSRKSRFLRYLLREKIYIFSEQNIYENIEYLKYLLTDFPHEKLLYLHEEKKLILLKPMIYML